MVMIVYFMVVSVITPTGNMEVVRYQYESLETCQMAAHTKAIEIHDLHYKQTVSCRREVYELPNL